MSHVHTAHHTQHETHWRMNTIENLSWMACNYEWSDTFWQPSLFISNNQIVCFLSCDQITKHLMVIFGVAAGLKYTHQMKYMCELMYERNYITFTSFLVKCSLCRQVAWLLSADRQQPLQTWFIQIIWTTSSPVLFYFLFAHLLVYKHFLKRYEFLNSDTHLWKWTVHQFKAIPVSN